MYGIMAGNRNYGLMINYENSADSGNPDKSYGRFYRATSSTSSLFFGLPSSNEAYNGLLRYQPVDVRCSSVIDGGQLTKIGRSVALRV